MSEKEAREMVEWIQKHLSINEDYFVVAEEMCAGGWKVTIV